MPNIVNSQLAEARESCQTLLEMSRLMGTGLDPETCMICIQLCEMGVDPEALASLINQLRHEVLIANQTKSEIKE